MRLPVLKNADKNFTTWRMRFMAYAAVKKYRAAVQDQGDPDLPSQHRDPDLYDISVAADLK
jgi:spore germination protein YaaH